MADYELPLTAMQADRIQQLRRREAEGSAVPVPHCPAALLIISGHLDRAVLAAALDAMVCRQAALRVRIGGAPPRQLLMDGTSGLTVEELPGNTPQEREAAALNLLSQRSGEELDPGGPMAEFSLLPVSDGKSALLIRADQLVCDLWSLNQMLAQIGVTYTALATGIEPPGPLPLEYPAAVEDDLDWLDSPAGRAARERVSALIRDLRPLGLPAPSTSLRPAPGWQTRRWQLGGADLLRLRLACRRHQCTLFTAVLAAFGAAVGRPLELATTPVQLMLTGRDRAAHGPLIMWRSNTLPAWVPVTGLPGRELLRQVQRRSFETLQFQRVPWPLAAAEHGVPPDISLHYIPPALTPSGDPGGFAGLDVDYRLGTPCFTGAPLDLLVSEDDDTLAARCVFRQDLVAAEFAERALADFGRLLTGLA